MKIIDHVTMVKEMPPLSEKDKKALKKCSDELNKLAKEYDIKYIVNGKEYTVNETE